MKNELTRLTGRDEDKLVMRAKNLKDVPDKKLSQDELYECSPKLDGVYCQVLRIDGKMQAFSRTGEKLLSVEHIEEFFNQPQNFAAAFDHVWIGELWHPEKDQEVISGMARRHEQSPELLFVVHDCVSLKDYIAGHSNEPFYSRIAHADRLLFRQMLHLKQLNGWTRWDWEMPTKAVPVRVLGRWLISLNAAKGSALSLIRAGHEGIIIRSRGGMWSANKRNEHYIRIKEKLTYDLEVIGVQEGVGKCAGMAGNLILRWRVGGKSTGEETEIYAIGGDYEQRRDWFHNPSEVIGKIAEVEAMKIGKNGILREPRVKSIRWDKGVADL